MRRTTAILALAASALAMSACQTTPHEFNGQNGYKVLERSDNTATLSYILSGRPSQDENRLQAACKQVLGASKNYNIQVLSTNEVVNPANKQVDFGRQIGSSRAQISLSNTPGLYNSEDYGTRQALEAHPTTVRVIRFSCS